jgi:hypothetical protein
MSIFLLCLVEIASFVGLLQRLFLLACGEQKERKRVFLGTPQTPAGTLRSLHPRCSFSSAIIASAGHLAVTSASGLSFDTTEL